jgi:hypothetical protein
MGLLEFIGRNWKVLLLLFGLGGAATVVSVVPGLGGVGDVVNGQVQSAKGKLVSATTVE